MSNVISLIRHAMNNAVSNVAICFPRRSSVASTYQTSIVPSGILTNGSFYSGGLHNEPIGRNGSDRLIANCCINRLAQAALIFG